MQLRYVILYVADVGATMDFYARAFGLELRFLHEGGDYGEMATGDTRLAFSSIALMQSLGKQVATAAPERPSFELAFATDDVPAALDRALAARFGFLLAIPAVFASGLFSLPDAFTPSGEGMSATGVQLSVSVVISFVVGFIAVSWLLRFLTHHAMYWFVGYRVVLALTVMALLGTGVVAAQ